MRNNLEDLEKILICPAPECHSRVRIVERRVICTNVQCRRSYRIDDLDIAHMLESEAIILPPPGQD